MRKLFVANSIIVALAIATVTCVILPKKPVKQVEVKYDRFEWVFR